MIPATDKQAYADGESSSPLAGRLDLLLQHAITTEQFEADMVRACRQDPEEIWTLLALLDQYHRQESLPTALFRALKASADRYGLVRREPYLPNPTPRPRPPAAPPPAPRAGPETSPPPAVPEPRPSSVVSPAPAAPPPRASASPTPTPLPTPHAPEPPAELEVQDESDPSVEIEYPPTRTLAIGGVVGGRYRLEAELEGDDRGRNFEALDLQHAGQPAAVCQVAVHCAEPGSANFETILAERRAEFQLAQPLAHPNVLTVRELDQDGVYIYLTMNLMRGETLAALLARRRGKPLARPAAFAILRDVGAALSYAHDHGVVHGNLQPQSILISPAGEVRVRGFGAQRASSSYASGEQLESRPPDRRDDLYALACISYELLSAAHPFYLENASTARGRGMTPARPIQLSGAQWRALRNGLAWRREGRNLSIARWLGRMHLRSASKRVPALEALMAMPPPRRSWAPALLMLVVLAAAAAVAVSLYRSPGAIDVTGSWNALRAAVTERIHAAMPASAPEPSAPPPQAASPSPEAAPPVQAHAIQVTPPSLPESAPVAAAPVPAPAQQPTPPVPPPAVLAAPSETAPAAPQIAPATPPRPAAAGGSESAAKPAAAKAMPAEASAGVARVGLSADHYSVQPGDSAAHLLVRRSGSARGEVRFAWWTENASASADLDFVAWGRRIERIPAGQSSVTLLVPVIKDATRNTARSFYVLIGNEGNGSQVDGITRATVQLPGRE